MTCQTLCISIPFSCIRTEEICISVHFNPFVTYTLMKSSEFYRKVESSQDGLRSIAIWALPNYLFLHSNCLTAQQYQIKYNFQEILFYVSKPFVYSIAFLWNGFFLLNQLENHYFFSAGIPLFILPNSKYVFSGKFSL